MSNNAPDSRFQPMTASVPEIDPREYCKFRYSAPSECCKCGNCQLVPLAQLVAWSDLIERQDARCEALEKALRRARISLNAVAVMTDSVSFHADVAAIDAVLPQPSTPEDR